MWALRNKDGATVREGATTKLQQWGDVNQKKSKFLTSQWANIAKAALHFQEVVFVSKSLVQLSHNKIQASIGILR